jgi:hypothetical protein
MPFLREMTILATSHDSSRPAFSKSRHPSCHGPLLLKHAHIYPLGEVVYYLRLAAQREPDKYRLIYKWRVLWEETEAVRTSAPCRDQH